MSVVFSTPHNRLARRVGNAGLSKTQAVDQANARVETLRQPTIAYVDENLQLLRQLFAQTDGASPAPYGRLYDASNAIAGTASLFGLDSLGLGAFSLCELLAHLEEQKTWSAPAVSVHLNSLLIMREFQPSNTTDEAAIILENLARLLCHVQGIEMKAD